MNSLVAFFLEHWLLSSGFLIVGFLLIVNEWRRYFLGIEGVTVQQLVNLMNQEGAIVVDVRAVTQFAQGHILGAINIVQSEFVKQLNVLTKYKNKPLILVDVSDPKVAKLKKALSDYPFKIYYLAGGMASWHSNGMPVVKK